MSIVSDTEQRVKGYAEGDFSGHRPSDEFGKKRLTGQLNDLFEIIARPRVQVLLDTTESAELEQVRLRVEPRMFQPGLMQITKVSLSLESSFLAFGNEVHLDKQTSALDSADQVTRKEDGTLLSATWMWDGQAVSDAGEVVLDQTTLPTLDFDSVEATVTLQIDYRAAESADIQPQFEYKGSPGVDVGSETPRESAGVLDAVYS